MKLIKLVALVFMLGVLSPVSVMAEEEEELLSAAELLANCEKDYTPGSPNEYCMQYVFGLLGHLMVQQQMEGSKQVICIDPNQVTPPMVADKVVEYLRTNSSRGKESAQSLVTEAFVRKYPCG